MPFVYVEITQLNLEMSLKVVFMYVSIILAFGPNFSLTKPGKSMLHWCMRKLLSSFG